MARSVQVDGAQHPSVQAAQSRVDAFSHGLDAGILVQNRLQGWIESLPH